MQRFLDSFYHIRGYILTAVAYLSLRAYGIEVTWEDVTRETYTPAEPDNRNADVAADPHGLLTAAEAATKNAETRRESITEKSKILLTLSSLLVAAVGLLLPKGLLFPAIWMKIVFFLSALALLNAVTLLLVFFGVGNDTIVSIDQRDVSLPGDDLKRSLINANFRSQASIDNRTDYLVDLYKAARFFVLIAFTAIVVLFTTSFFQRRTDDVAAEVVRLLRAEPTFIQQARGPAGEKGDRGDKGDPGEKGDRGDPGEKGERGEKGEAVAKGEPAPTASINSPPP